MYWDHPNLETFLWELATKCKPGEVTLHDGSAQGTPQEWLQALSKKELNASLNGYESSPAGEFVRTEIRSWFGNSQRRFSVHWSPDREGWALPQNTGRTSHYYVPKLRMSDPPNCGEGILISLCKRSFFTTLDLLGQTQSTPSVRRVRICSKWRAVSHPQTSVHGWNDARSRIAERRLNAGGLVSPRPSATTNHRAE